MRVSGVFLVGSVLSMGCTKSDDPNLNVQKRILTTKFLTFDAGMVAINTSELLSVYLLSQGQGEVRVHDLQVDDPDRWTISEDWKTDDCDGDGANDCQIIAGGSEDSPSYSAEIPILFSPEADDEFRTILTIVSDDNEVTERTGADEELGIWRVVLRGIGRRPCAYVYPTFHDFGSVATGGFFSTKATIQNCGVVTLTVSDADISGSSSFSMDSEFPAYALAGGSTEVDIAFQPNNDGAHTAAIDLLLDDPVFEQSIRVVGNDCSVSVDEDCGADVHPHWVDNDGDGYSEREGDCDDKDEMCYPGAEELVDDVDNDCDGNVDEGSYHFDDDADGFDEMSTPADCGDDDPWSWPGAIEDCDDRDNDCDGKVDEGEDDVEGGACAFVVPREPAEEKACATASAAPAVVVVLSSLLGLARRREG